MSTLEDEINVLETQLREYIALPLAERLIPTTAALIAAKKNSLTELRRQSAVSAAAIRASAIAAIPGPPLLNTTYLRALCLPTEVQIPREVDAPFLTQEWLDETIKLVADGYCTKDTISRRVAPMALVRCSRGGKTRALFEIAGAMKKNFSDCAVIYVSFSGWSSLRSWEQSQPLEAMCRRIAASALYNFNLDFDGMCENYEGFCNANVSASTVLEWLGDTPCVLLIDKLNNLTSWSNDKEKSEELAQFLKDNFLSPKNRYFVFSSDVVTTTRQLRTFMDSNGSRGVFIRALPLIRNVFTAANAFAWPTLNARMMLFYGLIPALIFMAQLQEQSKSMMYLPFFLRDRVISHCIENGYVNDDSVRNLVLSFISGHESLIPSPILPLMNTVEQSKVLWIPFHMTEMLKRFSSYVSYPTTLNKIGYLFDDFMHTDNAWESLFVMVLLIRCLSRQFTTSLLPVQPEKLASSTVSFNSYFRIGRNTFGEIISLNEFVSCLTTPLDLPHIAIYHSTTYVQFETVDVIVAVYYNASERELYGYQLNEFKTYPSKSFADAKYSAAMACIFRLRGVSAKDPTESHRLIVPSEHEINIFFGDSGKYWTPKRWEELLKSQRTVLKTGAPQKELKIGENCLDSEGEEECERKEVKKHEMEDSRGPDDVQSHDFIQQEQATAYGKVKTETKKPLRDHEQIDDSSRAGIKAKTRFSCDLDSLKATKKAREGAEAKN